MGSFRIFGFILYAADDYVYTPEKDINMFCKLKESIVDSLKSR